VWQWLVPLAAALLIFCGVLLSTPPGFAALPSVLLNTARGQNAEAAAYALGAAATLALTVLIALSGACFVIGLLRRRA
jgi:hypothetical protein